MAKVRIDSNAFLYPMPMVLVGADVDGRPNYMTAAWVTRVKYKPPYVGVALGKTHYTSRGIHRNREFGISVPDRRLAAAVDCAGIVSGARTDKSELFGTFRGRLAHAPMAAECPAAMECRLLQAVDLGDDEFVIGEIVHAWADKGSLTGGKPDVRKIDPFLLTMPDNRYWAVGRCVGRAWAIGRKLKERLMKARD